MSHLSCAHEVCSPEGGSALGWDKDKDVSWEWRFPPVLCGILTSEPVL